MISWVHCKREDDLLHYTMCMIDGTKKQGCAIIEDDDEGVLSQGDEFPEIQQIFPTTSIILLHLV